jgi:hypothetical protein
MTARLQKFVQETKNKKEEEAQRLKEVREQALSQVPRCALNKELNEEASSEELWQAVQEKFEWNFGPAKGKSLKNTKTAFLKWAMRKLKDPVRTICQIEIMLREKKLTANNAQENNDLGLTLSIRDQ